VAPHAIGGIFLRQSTIPCNLRGLLRHYHVERAQRAYETTDLKGKTMKNQQRLIALLAILVTVLAYASFAATTDDSQNQTPLPPPQGPMGGPGGPQMRPGMGQGGLPLLGALRALDLTADQQTAVKAIMDKNRDAMRTAGKAVGDANKAFHDAVAADANEPAIRTAATAVATAMANHAVLQVKTSIAIKALLTTDQLQKLADMQAKMKDRPAGPMGGQMDGPRGDFGRPDGPGPRPEPQPID
jgi:Spy/CpxP family protein refolding chaperone